MNYEDILNSISSSVAQEDIQEYIDADDDIIELKKKTALQEEKVEYLEAIVKGLSNRGYLIKNAIDWKRFTEGH